jgi:tetratricopeptide (TPR) repeat protein
MKLRELSYDQLMRIARYAEPQGKISRAVNALEVLTLRDTTDIQPYTELTRILLNQPEKSDSLIRFALQQINGGLGITGKDKNAEALFIKSQCHLALAPKQTVHRDTAVAISRRLDSLQPKAYNTRLLQAQVAEMQDDTSQAIQLYKSLFQRRRHDLRAALPLVKLLLGKGNNMEAIEYSGEALSVNNRVPKMWELHARSQNNVGMTEEAITAIQKALALPIEKEYKKRLQELLQQYKAQREQRFQGRQGSLFD